MFETIKVAIEALLNCRLIVQDYVGFRYKSFMSASDIDGDVFHSFEMIALNTYLFSFSVGCEACQIVLPIGMQMQSTFHIKL